MPFLFNDDIQTSRCVCLQSVSRADYRDNVTTQNIVRTEKTGLQAEDNEQDDQEDDYQI